MGATLNNGPVSFFTSETTAPNSKNVHLPIARRSELEVKIFSISLTALLDSGASISAISEQLFLRLQQNVPEGQRLAVLPVTGMTITTAVQGRSKKVTQQVLLNIIIGAEPAEGIFLVVPHLATPMILGDDWLTRNQVILDYQNHIIVFPSWQKSLAFQPPTNGVGQGKCSLISVTQRPQNVPRSTLEHCLSKVFVTNAYLNPPQCVDRQEVISTMNCESDQDLRGRVRSIENISTEEREQLLALLMDYRHLFSDRPGLNNCIRVISMCRRTNHLR